jgi:prepilin-type processing-associated H-X9-DG protein
MSMAAAEGEGAPRHRAFRLTPAKPLDWVLAVAGGLLGLIVLVRLVVPGSCPQEPRRQFLCVCRLRQIGLAIKLYAQDHGEAFPPDLGVLYPEYVDNPKVFSCPSNPGEWQRIEDTGEARPEWTSYVYVAGLTDADPAECVLAYCRPGNHGEDGLNVLFLDTHVEWCTFEEFEQHLARTRALGRQSGREVRLVGE